MVVPPRVRIGADAKIAPVVEHHQKSAARHSRQFANAAFGARCRINHHGIGPYVGSGRRQLHHRSVVSGQIPHNGLPVGKSQQLYVVARAQIAPVRAKKRQSGGSDFLNHRRLGTVGTCKTYQQIAAGVHRQVPRNQIGSHVSAHHRHPVGTQQRNPRRVQQLRAKLIILHPAHVRPVRHPRPTVRQHLAFGILRRNVRHQGIHRRQRSPLGLGRKSAWGAAKNAAKEGH